MSLDQAGAHALVGWFLVAPAQAPTKGTVRASPSPTVRVGHTYESKEQCEQDRDFLQRDPIIGPQMKSAKCVPSNQTR
jgi:hypothetical protein